MVQNKAMTYRVFAMLTLVCMLIGLCGIPVYAAKTREKNGSDYVYVLYNSQNGLPTSEANDILQTDDGLIWIASYGGLTRYDGKKYERISAENGISSANKLMIDSDKNLWVGTNDGGIAVYAGGFFSHITVQDGLPSNTVKALLEGGKNEVYIGTSAGLALFHRDTGVIDTFIGTVLGNDSIVSLAKAKDGSIICVVNNRTVYRIKDGIVSADTELKNDQENGIVSVYVDKHGTEYYGTAGTNIIKRVYVNGRAVNSVLNCGTLKYINAIYRNSTEELWVCADNGIGYYGTAD